LGSAIGDLKHSLFTAVLILLSYVASILIVGEKEIQTIAKDASEAGVRKSMRQFQHT
jgi:hypothetical protein